MKTLLGLIIWTVQLVYLIIGATFNSIGRLFANVFSETKPHRIQNHNSSKPWLEKFVVLYINKCLILDGDITDIKQLSSGDLNFSQMQSLTVYLKAYLYKIRETYEPSDVQDVLKALPQIWNIHATGFRSEGAVRAWCMDQNPDGTKDDVDAFISSLKEVDKTSEDWAHLSKSLLQFRFARVFTRQHLESFLSFTDTMLEDYMASDSSHLPVA